MTNWEIHGASMGNCNCAYGCPCQFNALPTYGSCEAAVFYRFDQGHYGDVSLDGLKAAGMFKWPGPVHEGNGTMQLIIDEKATDEQVAALEAIMTGQDTDELATMWFVYSAMSPNKLPTLRLPIDFSIDIEERIGKGMAGDILKVEGEPIRNPVTGAVHRARIDLPHGFEYSVAEMGSGITTSSGEIDLNACKDTYAQFNELHLGPSGVLAA